MIDSFRNENRWLSNFWPCKIKFDSEWYSSVEAAYVASKTTDLKIRKKISKMTNPVKIKRFGKTIKLRLDWEEVKVQIMLGLLRQKFKKGSSLGNRLLATGNQKLIEGNTWGDTFWGVCQGKGLNVLGKLLMQVRDEISRCC